MGDVVWKKQDLNVLNELNGRKILIKGNHDNFDIELLLEYFEDIHGVLYKKGFIFSHFPVHEGSINPRFKGNIHGHTHSHVINDSRYFNVSVESPNRKLIGVPEVEPIDFDLIINYFNNKSQEEQ